MSAAPMDTSGQNASHYDFCMKQAQEYKAAGNEALLAGDYTRAIGRYLRVQGCTAGLQAPAAIMSNPALQYLTHNRTGPALTDRQQAELGSFMLTVHLNLSQAYLKTGDFQRAGEYADKVIAVDPRNVKALFRRGCAFLNLKDASRAVVDLAAAHSLNPQDSAILNQLNQARKVEKMAQDASEKQMRESFKNMFSR